MGTFEVTLQYFAYFISISSLVFENDKWTFWGCFGHFNMSHLLKSPVLLVSTLVMSARCPCVSTLKPGPSAYSSVVYGLPSFAVAKPPRPLSILPDIKKLFLLNAIYFNDSTLYVQISNFRNSSCHK